jgi:hypothetical protein
MVMSVSQHADERGSLQALGLNIPTLLFKDGMTCSGKCRRMGHLASRDKSVTGVSRQPESVQQEAASNFFENRATEYSKASTTGSWEDVWATSVGDSWAADPV